MSLLLLLRPHASSAELPACAPDSAQRLNDVLPAALNSFFTGVDLEACSLDQVANQAGVLDSTC